MTAETWLALVAIAISVFSIWLQYTIEGPKVDILNNKDIQQITPRKYDLLPNGVKDKFPYLYVTQSGHALVKVVYGNSGDRSGIVTVKDMKLIVKDSVKEAGELIRGTFDKYFVVPAYEIVEQGIFLRNIPVGPQTLELEIQFTIECGGYHPRNGKYLKTGIIYESLKVKLVPSVGPENDFSPVPTI